jgi:hypothetical protein
MLFFQKAPHLEWNPEVKVKCKIDQSTGMFQNQTCRCPILHLNTSFESQISIYYRDVRSRSASSAKKGPRSAGQKNGHFFKTAYLPWYTRRALPGINVCWLVLKGPRSRISVLLYNAKMRMFFSVRFENARVCFRLWEFLQDLLDSRYLDVAQRRLHLKNIQVRIFFCAF